MTTPRCSHQESCGKCHRHPCTCEKQSDDAVSIEWTDSEGDRVFLRVIYKEESGSGYRSATPADLEAALAQNDELRTRILSAFWSPEEIRQVKAEAAELGNALDASTLSAERLVRAEVERALLDQVASLRAERAQWRSEAEQQADRDGGTILSLREELTETKRVFAETLTHPPLLERAAELVRRTILAIDRIDAEGTRIALSDMREWLKEEFNGEFVSVGGKAHRVAKSTKGRDALQPFIERVVAWLIENYQPPHEALDPESFKRWQAEVFPSGGPDDYIDYLCGRNLLK